MAQKIDIVYEDGILFLSNKGSMFSVECSKEEFKEVFMDRMWVELDPDNNFIFAFDVTPNVRQMFFDVEKDLIDQIKNTIGLI